MAGFSVIRASEPAGADAGGATVADGATRRSRRGTRRAERRAARRERPRRFTWRVGLFVLVLAAILGIGLAAIGYYARGTYFVGFDADGVVTIYQGKPGGVLWFDPTVVERTELTRDDVRPEVVDNLEAGIELSSLDRAQIFTVSLVTTTTTTTTTTGPATTTTTP
jgi:protein phosphatase